MSATWTEGRYVGRGSRPIMKSYGAPRWVSPVDALVCPLVAYVVALIFAQPVELDP